MTSTQIVGEGKGRPPKPKYDFVVKNSQKGKRKKGHKILDQRIKIQIKNESQEQSIYIIVL